MSLGAVGGAYHPGNDYRLASGYVAGGTKQLVGDISEVLLYDRPLNDTKLQRIGAYMNEKYRLNSNYSAIPVTVGRVFHVAADTIQGVAEGGTVSSWTDISGSGNHAAAINTPRYFSQRVNGKPVVRFDGDDSFQSPVATAQDMSFFVVVKGSPYQSALRWQPGAWLVYHWFGGLIQQANNGTDTSIQTGLVDNEWNIGSVVIDTGTASGVRTFRNGSPIGTGTWNAAWGPLSPMYIGSIGGGSEFTTGDFAEIIVYNRALSDNERRLVERFLAAKYGLDGKGPGGVDTGDIELWLKADPYQIDRLRDDRAFNWDDSSGADRRIYQDTNSKRPDYVSNIRNGYPGIRTSPNDSSVSGGENWSSDFTFPGGREFFSIFAGKSNTGNSGGFHSLIRFQGGPAWYIHPWGNQLIINQDGGTGGVGTNLDDPNWLISAGRWKANTVNGFQTWKNGVLQNQRTSANVTLAAGDPLYIGAYVGQSEYSNADVGEIILFSDELDSPNMNLLNNYLAAKFDISIAGDVYLGDSVPMGNYDHNVAGIGREGDLPNPHSGQPAIRQINQIANAGGLIIQDMGFLQNATDYVVAGHNGAANTSTNANLMGTGAQNRWTREWYLDITDSGGNGGNITLRFDHSDAGFNGVRSGRHVLLRRADPNGLFIRMAAPATILEDEVSFTLNTNSLGDGYFTLAEEDTIAPVITLNGAAVTVECGGTFTDPGWTATDNSDGNITGNVLVSGSVNTGSPNTYTLRYNITDTNGNPAIERTRLVTVSDTTPPVINLIGAATINVQCGSGAFSDPGATALDACSGNLTTAIVKTGLPIDTTSVGTRLITYNVVDGAGLPAAQVTRTVNVIDDTPPVLLLNGPGVMNVQCGASFNDPGANAVDACVGSVPVVIGGAAVNTAVPGPYVVTYNATDGTNAAPQQTRTVNVVDTTPPVLTVNGAAVINIECGSPFTDPGASAVDACAGVVPVVTGGSVNVNLPGIYQLTYNATDGTNAAPQQTRTVNVNDTEAPITTLTGGDVTVVLNQPYVEPGATAVDACEGAVSVTITGTVNTNSLGTYTRFYNAEDSGGRDAVERTRQVQVVEGQPPVITRTGPASITLECGSGPYVDQGATASDPEDGDVTGDIVTVNPVNTLEPDTYTVTYNVVDSSGNPATEVTRTVVVEDTTPPTLTRNGAATITIECGGTFNDPGVTAGDTCDTAIQSRVTVGGTAVDTSDPGTYNITYDVSDESGNAAPQVTRTVIVEDTAIPVITRIGAASVNVNCGSTYTDAGVTATDACDGTLTANVVTVGLPVNTSNPGSYTVRYNVSDAEGNPALEVTRTVNVVDNTPPVITRIGASVINVQCRGVYNDPGATATDACDGNAAITQAIVRTGLPIDTANPGTYTVRYNVTDAEGNSAAEVTRTVNVIDTQAPVITLNGSALLTIEVGGVYTEAGATATDSCEGDVPVTIGGASVNTGNAGTYIVTYNAVDSEGNAAPQVIRTINVTLGIQPVINQQPQPAMVPFGQQAQFQVSAAGLGVLTYRWKRNGTPLNNGAKYNGVTTSTLTVNNSQNADEGNYSVTVTDGNVSVDSSVAPLTVQDPGIIQEPADQVVQVGVTAQMQVVAVGSGTLSYQWFKNGNPVANGGRISGATTATLTISNTVDFTDDGTYWVVVTGSVDPPVESRHAELTIGNPGIVTPPVSQTVDPGDTVQFSVTAVGNPPLVHKWRRNGVNIQDGGRFSGSNTSVLTISNVQQSDEAEYSCSVVGQNIVVSPGATLTVNDPPVIANVLVLPPSGILSVEGPAVLVAELAGGTEPFTYQWRKNDQNLSNSARVSGVNLPVLSINSALPSDAGDYSLIVTNSAGSATSEEVTVRVGLTFTRDLDDRLAEDGSTFVWSIGVEGARGTLEFEWQKEDGSKAWQTLVDGPGVSGATSAHLTLSPVGFDDTGVYRVLASDNDSTIVSRMSTLTVVEGLPAAGLLGLVSISAMFAAGAVLNRRRRK